MLLGVVATSAAVGGNVMLVAEINKGVSGKKLVTSVLIGSYIGAVFGFVAPVVVPFVVFAGITSLPMYTYTKYKLHQK